MMKSSYLFLILTILMLSLGIFSSIVLEIDDLTINSLGERFSQEQVKAILDYKKGWQWFSYIFIPLFLLIKISVITAILDIGCFFYNKQIQYKKLFNIVVRSEFIFLLVLVSKTAWFSFFQTDYSLEDLQYFYPLSVLNAVGYENMSPWFVYPLQTLNLFEVAYWIILAYLLDRTINDHTFKGMSIVASSYGAGLLIWVVGVMFFTLNIS